MDACTGSSNAQVRCELAHKAQHGLAGTPNAAASGTYAPGSGCKWRLTLGVGEVDHGAVSLEQVDLLDGGDVVDAQALQGALEALIVGAHVLVDSLALAADGTLAAGAALRARTCEQ